MPRVYCACASARLQAQQFIMARGKKKLLRATRAKNREKGIGCSMDLFVQLRSMFSRIFAVEKSTTFGTNGRNSSFFQIANSD